MQKKKNKPKIKQEAGLREHNKPCMGCTGCCYSHVIPEINKPAETMCPHAVPGVGCQIYETRPQSCRDFACMWSSTRGFIDPSDRPDKVGVVIDVTRDGSQFGRQIMVARPSEPEAFRKLTATLTIARLAERGLIVIIEGDKRQIAGPPAQLAQARAFLNARLK